MTNAKKLGISIDLGGTNVRIALGDSGGRILARRTEPTEKTMGPEGISRQMIRIIQSLLLKETGLQKIQGIGIGSTGPLDLRRGSLMKPTNIPYDSVPLVKPLEDEFHLPTRLLNDCVSGVLGEKFFGAGKNHDNLVYITLSTGIGGGAYVDGHLLMGKDGNAHEIGHFTIDFEGKLPCSCGKKGHWEAYCSGNGIPNYVRLLLNGREKEEIESSLLVKKTEGKFDKTTARILYDSAKAGDPLSTEIVQRIGVLNAIGFGCVVDAYDPSLITVGGSIALNNSDSVIGPIREHISNYIRNRVPEMTVTPLREDVVLYGALAAIFHPNE